MTPAEQTTPEGDYLHGYCLEEQQRLVRQAAYWRGDLIPVHLAYQQDERVLEIGCGAGATLGEIAKLFPGINVAGVDIEPRQIEFARTHLRSLGIEADLRVGNGVNLSWDSGYFDHVYIMWLLEHLKDATAILRESHRVLRCGGTITITETDYTSFKVTPFSADWDYLEKAQYEFFARHGNPIAGRQLGLLLSAAGFTNVRNGPVGFHFFHGGEGLRQHVDYLLEFLKPSLPKMASLGFDLTRLQKGAEYLDSVPNRPGGSMTTIVYRAHGAKTN
jgi:ubiquinone/menaquinone biosynthesis C-methylase UbiE